ncbi:sulfotransferase [Thermocoleostomius sinensis]|jgi:hypothetical protein|uniref:Sulfotransferase n=1 Tax=Thermocoleostomius sinensis A174 TaxID=2016057 RepID=A0A9E8Z968_9CYAN|nr:sulfotransferase [Thermocoleostomius sinensis]WAL58597.1 sulfotransferase [Thermocoleostomius sinensis A174]
MNKRYLFICGCPRSGTTAITALLNTHPTIAIGMERYKYRIHRNIKTIDASLFEAENFFNFCPQETNILPSQGNWTRLYQQMETKFMTQSDLLVGDKNPFYFNVYEQMEAAMKKTKWIFMLRNIEQVAASYNVRAANPQDSWLQNNNYVKAVEHWNSALAKTWKFFSKNPMKLFVCEYELFFAGNEAYFQDLLKFLEVECESNTLRDYRAITKDWQHRQRKLTSLDDRQRTYIHDHAKLQTSNRLVSASRQVHCHPQTLISR